jgi:hypothetical protein
LKTFLIFLLLSSFAATRIQAQAAFTDMRSAETQTHDEIVRIIGEKNINFREQSLMPDYGAFGKSIETLFPSRSGLDGETKSLFVLALPITSSGGKYTFSTGKLSWGQELAFKFMDMLLAEPPPFDTLIYFAGDNWPAVSPDIAYPYAGLQALLNQIENREDVILMYCDFTESPDAIQIVKKKGESAAPLALVEPFFRVCEEYGIPCFFNAIDTGLDNFPKTGDIAMLYTNGDAPARFNILQNGKKISAGEAAITIYKYAAEITRNKIDAENTDRNYAYIGFKGENIFIPEYTLVLLAIFASAAVCFLCFFLFYAAKSRIKRFLISVSALVLLLSLIIFIVLQINTSKNIQQTTRKSQQQTENIVTEQYFTAKTEEIQFLNRKIVRIKINARREPLQYRLFFTRKDTESPLYFIYDAPMPYNTIGIRTEFILGSYPPASLSFEIALPRNIDGNFVIEALFKDNINVIQNLP